MTIKTTTFEIWGISDGKVGNFAIDTCISLKRAQESASHFARGDMINESEWGPSKPIFELADGEVLRPGMSDGLYIRKKVSISEPQFVG